MRSLLKRTLVAVVNNVSVAVIFNADIVVGAYVAAITVILFFELLLLLLFLLLFTVVLACWSPVTLTITMFFILTLVNVVFKAPMR